MKIHCDVCSKDEAAVYCTADEAALCSACDHRVHHANKLASKHQRFSLINPSAKQAPLCDICQERLGFLFCQQDRAILCRECDLPIHSANELTKKHNRFLLTGVKLSATSAVYVPDQKVLPPASVGKLRSVSPVIPQPPSVPKICGSLTTATASKGAEHDLTSSISEYMEMLPGWHVEDFLDSSSFPFSFSKDDDSLFPDLGVDVQTNLNSGIWVPQTPASQCPAATGGGQQIWFRQTKDVAAATNILANSTWSDGFTVPQMSPSIGSKRSRTFW